MADASPKHVPEEVLARAKASLLDTIGVALAGAVEGAAHAVRQVYTAAPSGRHRGVAVLGTGERRALLDGVVCNAFAAHALDFDDTVQGATTHPSCHLVPALLAVAEDRRPDTTVLELLVAHIVGIEVETAIAKAVNPALARRGWHTTGVLGAIATAAAVACLLGLPPDDVRGAIAIACSSASGLRANFGSPVKPLHAALAARSGVEAALLAQAGLHGAHDPFDHRFGFFPAYVGDSAAVDRSWLRPADESDWQAALEITLKPFPCCGEATALVQGAVDLSTWLGGRGIDRIQLGLTPFAREILEFDDPRSPDEARFSGQYCVAVALKRGGLSIGDFDADALGDAEVRALVARTVAVVDPQVTGHGGSVTVTAADGATSTAHVRVPVGHASVGMRAETAAAKFVDCARGALGSSGAERMYARIAGADLESRAMDLLTRD
ncbi:MAG TPA: MmgE/PrpD family protein [Amycolatopsis sp.]|nr:MmgE/PrpD family protein [Amycolatopsis sp.]